jgi:transcriptional regulator with XRE-family HTH domain
LEQKTLIKIERIKKGFSQVTLANRMSISRGTLVRWERGHTKMENSYVKLFHLALNFKGNDLGFEDNPKMVRENLGLSQVQFAKKLGLNQATISRWENGAKISKAHQRLLWFVQILDEKEIKVSADLHIHVFRDGELTEEDFKYFFSNTLDSKWGLPLGDPRALIGSSFQKEKEKRRDKIYSTPSVWIGEVSWLKAALSGEETTYVPNTVGSVNEIIGENLPTIDDNLIKRIGDAFDLPKNTSYNIAEKKGVIEFLTQHKGWKAFTISW